MRGNCDTCVYFHSTEYFCQLDDSETNEVNSCVQYEMNWEERHRRFMKEYEELTKKYQMGFVMADIWDSGMQCLEVWDEKEKTYIYD